MVEAMIDAFGRYATFAGRSRRGDFWWFTVFLLLVYALAFLLDTSTNTSVFGAFALLAFLLPSLSLLVRRLHDSDRSARWLLIVFLPVVGALGLLVMAALPSDTDENSFGPPVEKPDW
jgi:uncharacterized membrane protein YhaH (DUF805 family)